MIASISRSHRSCHFGHVPVAASSFDASPDPHRGRRVQALGNSSRRMPPGPPPANNAGSDSRGHRQLRSLETTPRTRAGIVRSRSQAATFSVMRVGAASARELAGRTTSLAHQSLAADPLHCPDVGSRWGVGRGRSWWSAWSAGSCAEATTSRGAPMRSCTRYDAAVVERRLDQRGVVPQRTNCTLNG